MDDELNAAIDRAYRVFARYSLRGRLQTCSCPLCVDDATADRLRTVPLRQLSSQLLAEYTHSAHGWDDRIADEFRYFLPRYLELIAAEDVPSHFGIETCLGRMHAADFRDRWPAVEAEAIDGFFLALFRARLNEPFEISPFGLPTWGGDGVEDTLCMVANAGGDVASLLATWEADSSREAILHIANIVGVANWSRQKLRNAFWTSESREGAANGMRQVVDWLLRDEIRGAWKRPV